MLDIVVFGFIIFMAVWGYKSGFVRSVFHLGYYVISAIVSTLLYPFIADYLMKTAFAEFIKGKVIAHYIANNANAIKMDGLPQFLKDPISNGISNTLDVLATSMTYTIISLISIVVVFLVVRFGLKFVEAVLHKIASLPILSFFNKTGGFIVGVINGFIIVYLALAIAAFFVPSNFYKIIESSVFTNHLYNDNLLIKFIFH